VNSVGGSAIEAFQLNAAGTGNVFVTTGPAALTGTTGIDASNAGTGVLPSQRALAVTGSAGSAISAVNSNALSTGNILVTAGAGGATGTGADAVAASTLGTGT
jgi:hypothetical protein